LSKKKLLDLNLICSMDSKLVEKLDFVFSRYVKLRDTDQYGYGSCIATGKRVYYYLRNERWCSNAEAGHCVPRGNYSTRWMEENVNIQEVMSNRGGFDISVMKQNIDKKFGCGTVAMIEEKEKEFGKKTYEIDNRWIQEKIEYYHDKINMLLKDKMF
jgi:hypothetical protein